MINKMTIRQVGDAARQMREHFPDCTPVIVARPNGANSLSLVLVPMKEWTTLDGKPTSTMLWESSRHIAQTWHAQRHHERQRIRRIADACRQLIKEESPNAE